MLTKLKSLVRSIWAVDAVRRVIHTFWQTFLAVFGAGILGVVSLLLQTHRVSDAASALLALVIAAVAAGLSAVKAYWVSRKARA